MKRLAYLQVHKNKKPRNKTLKSMYTIKEMFLELMLFKIYK